MTGVEKERNMWTGLKGFTGIILAMEHWGNVDEWKERQLYWIIASCFLRESKFTTECSD